MVILQGGSEKGGRIVRERKARGKKGFCRTPFKQSQRLCHFEDTIIIFLNENVKLNTAFPVNYKVM